MSIPRQCSGDLYTSLEVDKTARDSDIKKSYHRLALKLHPDKTGGQTTEEFKRIVEANDVLSDPEQRKIYDTIGRSGMKKLEAYGMDSTMACFISHPMAIPCFTVLLWFISLQFLEFLILVNVRIDSKKGWAWAWVFTPVWIIFTPIFPLMIGAFVTNVRRGKYIVMLGNLQALLTMITVCCMVSSLDGHLSWNTTFKGIYIICAFNIISTINDLRLSKFKDLLSSDEVRITDSITYTSNIYLKHVAVNIISPICVLIFFILLDKRALSEDHENMNFYGIFSPLFVRFTIPLVERALCPSPSVVGATGSKVAGIIGLLIEYGVKMYMFVMIAVKCQKEVNEGLTGPSASTCTIPLYILLGSVVIMFSCVCTYLFLPDDNSDSASECGTERTACTEDTQSMHSTKYKATSEIDV